ncbi:hypothetical protein R1sor_018622 [Riccia sorocarpa]|uniref:Uncharacterized protein n=1 Tax=Riccia sorocarpa TaxID=122646 RepID=A0ABD3IDS6_9MARC
MYISAWTTVFAWVIRLIQAPAALLTAPVRVRKVSSELSQLQAKYQGLQIVNRDLERKYKLALHEHRQIQLKLQAQVISEVNKATEKCRPLKSRIKELEEQYDKLQDSQRKPSLTLDPPEKDVLIDFHSKSLVPETSPNGHTRKHSPRYSPKPIDEAATHIVPSKFARHLHHEKSLVLMERQSRGVAFMSSLFSAALSVIVALIAWQAQDPCFPLVFALFTVVGMSCANVIRFLSGVSQRLELDAMVLVGFNSFILGTLATQFLPYFAPRVMGIWWWFLGLMGLKSELPGNQDLLFDIFPSASVS